MYHLIRHCCVSKKQLIQTSSGNEICRNSLVSTVSDKNQPSTKPSTPMSQPSPQPFNQSSRPSTYKVQFQPYTSNHSISAIYSKHYTQPYICNLAVQSQQSTKTSLPSRSIIAIHAFTIYFGLETKVYLKAPSS